MLLVDVKENSRQTKQEVYVYPRNPPYMARPHIEHRNPPENRRRKNCRRLGGGGESMNTRDRERE